MSRIGKKAVAVLGGNRPDECSKVNVKGPRVIVAVLVDKVLHAKWVMMAIEVKPVDSF